MSVYHHIRQLVVQEFFLTRSDFPGKRQKLILFVFKSVCGRVVKPSGLNTCSIIV